jgi:XTP/dITP diphosphohydrolase
MRPKTTPHTFLIATTNPGKFEEFVSEFKDLPFTFVSLKDVGLDKTELEEPYQTTWENALHKAKFYATKSGLTTISEDTAFFIDALDGAPGINAKYYASSHAEARAKILTAMKGIPTAKRTAYFETTGVLTDPEGMTVHQFTGRLHGLISEQEIGTPRTGMIYESVFYHPPSKKHLSEMTTPEKNNISHRGQVITKIKFFLQKQYGFKQIAVPLAIIMQDGKLLMIKRRDSRPEFNNKWEFPGGGVEKGETVEDCIKRECLEETGLTIKIEEQVPQILTHYESKWNYQVFLMTFICSVVSGKVELRDNENSGFGWFTPEEALQEDLLPLNSQLITDVLPRLKHFSK